MMDDWKELDVKATNDIKKGGAVFYYRTMREIPPLVWLGKALEEIKKGDILEFSKSRGVVRPKHIREIT